MHAIGSDEHGRADINYDKCVIRGEVHTRAEEAYTSDNTVRLDVDGTVQRLLGTTYVQQALAGDV